MKKIFTLLIFMLVTSGLFATTYYWTGTYWSTTSGGSADGIAPGSGTGGDDFIIEASGYDVALGTSVVARDFTVNDDGLANIYFLVHGTINISGKLTVLNDKGGAGAGCAIYTGAYLNLSNSVVEHIINRPIIYDASDAKLSIYQHPGQVSTIYPGANGGILELNQPSYTYKFGATDVHLNDIRSIIMNADGITIEAQTLYLDGDYTLSKANSTFNINDNIALAVGKTLIISASGTSFNSINAGKGFIIGEGAKIITNNNTGSFDKLTILANSTQQGIIVGTGFTCSDVTMSVVPNWSRGDGTYGNYAWRELGTPFVKSVYGGDVSWGGDNEANINGNDGADVDPGNGGGSNSYINYWNASSQRWELPSSTGSGSGSGPYTSVVNFNNAFEVWYEGNATNTITVTNGSLATSHNSNYTVSTNNLDDWILIPNPYASFLDLEKVHGSFSSLIKGFMLYILTEGNGGYNYKTYDDFGDGTFGADGMNKKSIPPFQGFWMQAGRAGKSRSIDALTSMVSDVDGSELSKKLDKYSPPNLRLVLDNNDGNTQEVVKFSFIDNAEYLPEDYNAINMNGLADIATMYIPKATGNRIYEGHDISAIDGGAFNSDLEMKGNIDGTYKISIAGKTIAAELNVYLIDKQQGITHLLNDSDYSFSHSSTNDANRFNVFITSTTLGEAEKLEAKSIKLANKGNTVEFYMPSTSTISNVQFVNISGQLVKNVQASNGQTEFDVSGFTKGVYIAKLRLESGNEVSFKFVR